MQLDPISLLTYKSPKFSVMNKTYKCSFTSITQVMNPYPAQYLILQDPFWNVLLAIKFICYLQQSFAPVTHKYNSDFTQLFFWFLHESPTWQCFDWSKVKLCHILTTFHYIKHWFFFSFSIKNEVRMTCCWRQEHLSLVPSFSPSLVLNGYTNITISIQIKYMPLK